MRWCVLLLCLMTLPACGPTPAERVIYQQGQAAREKAAQQAEARRWWTRKAEGIEYRRAKDLAILREAGNRRIAAGDAREAALLFGVASKIEADRP